MIHEILPVGLLQCNCSIFGDEVSGEAMVIDPGDNIPQILTILERHGLRCTAIVITHAHIDHVGGAEKLKRATGAPVSMNEADSELHRHMEIQAGWLGVRPPETGSIDSSPRDGDSFGVGLSTFEVRLTPGHTPGSLCLWMPAEGKLVAGDTLFRDSVGRTDLPGGDHRQLLRSIHDKLLTLPDTAIVIPGHGINTTIGREREFNPWLRDLI